MGGGPRNKYYKDTLKNILQNLQTHHNEENPINADFLSDSELHVCQTV